MASVDAFFSKLNPLMRIMLGTPVLHWPLSGMLALITVTGRRSGKRYTIPVGYQRVGDQVVILVSEAHHKKWWRNYREPGPAQLRLRGRLHEGEACVVPPGDERFLRHCEHTLGRVPSLGRAFGIDFDRARGLTDDQARKLEAEVAVVEVSLRG